MISGIIGEQPPEGDALAHSAGQRARVVVTELRQAQELKQDLDPPGMLLLGNPRTFQSDRNVGGHVGPRQQRVALKHEPDIGARSRVAGNLDSPAGPLYQP